MRLVIVTQQPPIVKLHRSLVVGIPHGIGRMSISFLSFGAIRGKHESRRKVKYAISKDKDGNERIYFIGYEGCNENLSVPETILVENKNIPVKSISESSFKGCESLTSITMPSSVTSIGIGAFDIGVTISRK